MLDILRKKKINYLNFKPSPHGPIPNDWDVVRLSEVVEIYDHKRIPLSEKERSKRKGKYPYCGANGIIDYIDDFIFVGEYVLLAEDGGAYEKFGNSAYIMTGKFWVNNHAHVLKAIEDKLDNWFLMYVLNFLDLRPYIVGSTRTKLNQDQMNNIQIPLPPLPEQKRIAGVLRTVDEAIEKVEEEIEHTERLKRGLMQHLLTRGIGHIRFKDSPYGKIPKEWTLLPAEKVFTRITDGTHDTPKPTEKGYYLITSRHLKDNEIKFSEAYFISEKDFIEVNKRSKVDKGDVLFSMIGTVGITAVVKLDYPDFAIKNVGLFKTNGDFNLAYWLYYYFQSSLAKRYIKNNLKGSTQKYITLEVLRKFPIPLPPLPEQKKIAEILMTVDRKLELLRQKRDHMERLKKGLMNDLLTGRRRLRVSNSS